MIPIFKNLVRAGLYPLVMKASKNYFAGDSLENAIKLSEYLDSLGYHLTLGYLLEKDASIDAAVASYDMALSSKEWNKYGNYLSIKAKDFDFNDSYFKFLLNKSKQFGLPVHLDSIGPEYADATFDLIARNPQKGNCEMGISLPGVWNRSIADADRAVDLNLIPRIIKGQWPDPEDPQKNLGEGFKEVVCQLAGKAALVRIATHDLTLAKESINILKKSDTKFELELLYGLPVKEIITFAVSEKIPVRIYVPYGLAWLPYSLDAMWKRPSIALWFLKDLLRGSYASRFPNYS